MGGTVVCRIGHNRVCADYPFIGAVEGAEGRKMPRYRGVLNSGDMGYEPSEIINFGVYVGLNAWRLYAERIVHVYPSRLILPLAP